MQQHLFNGTTDGTLAVGAGIHPTNSSDDQTSITVINTGSTTPLVDQADTIATSSGTLRAGLYTKVSTTIHPDPTIISILKDPSHPSDELDRMRRLLEKEDKFLYSDYYKLLKEAGLAATHATSTTSLDYVNRADLDTLGRNRNLPLKLQAALICFLKRYKISKWKKGQKRYPQRIGITLPSPWPEGMRLALCGVHGWFCQLADYCPQCASRLRYQLAIYEFGDVFDRAPYWYALSPVMERNPDRAGLHFVVTKRNKKKGIAEKILHLNPYRGLPVGRYFKPDDDLLDPSPIAACFNSFFAFAKRLCRNGIFLGAFVQREIAWRYLPCRINPNAHLLVCTRAPITFEQAQILLEFLEKVYWSQRRGCWQYPDLHLEALTSQAEINRWLYYSLKPMNYVTGYLQAVRGGKSIRDHQLGD
jgi:hypothetical protein